MTIVITTMCIIEWVCNWKCFEAILPGLLFVNDKPKLPDSLTPKSLRDITLSFDGDRVVFSSPRETCSWASVDCTLVTTSYPLDHPPSSTECKQARDVLMHVQQTRGFDLHLSTQILIIRHGACTDACPLSNYCETWLLGRTSQRDTEGHTTPPCLTYLTYKGASCIQVIICKQYAMHIWLNETVVHITW